MSGVVSERSDHSCEVADGARCEVRFGSAGTNCRIDGHQSTNMWRRVRSGTAALSETVSSIRPTNSIAGRTYTYKPHLPIKWFKHASSEISASDNRLMSATTRCFPDSHRSEQRNISATRRAPQSAVLLASAPTADPDRRPPSTEPDRCKPALSGRSAG